MVDVHRHGGSHTLRALQRAVVVRQTAVVHLHQQVLLTLIATANGCKYRLLATAVSQ
ncbi:hypothetical protein [Xylanibacter ruminicola]|uniref:hypothetical protein n=1 Tax=Xylanibacter ruminicola TaxID=839 RepID=UPI001587365D|nr:hypothetical protein [Xylanibacter ruminicola]